MLWFLYHGWVFLVICSTLDVINGFMDIFIKNEEVQKLMGLEAELFYVREGTINNYAMQFVVPVPQTVEDLKFTWQSLIEKPLPYVISIEYETKKGALLAPQLNIPARGSLPTTMETFTVHLPCSGNVSEEVPIAINLKVRNPFGGGHNETVLHFKRNKICMRGPIKDKTPAPVSAPPQGPAVFSAMACAVGLILVVGLLFSAMYVRTKKQIRRDSLNNSFTTAHYGSHQNVILRLDPLGRPPSVNSGSYATIASLNKYPLYETKRSWFRTTRSASPSPYATALLPFGPNHQYNNNNETVYDKPESVCPSRASHYASSQLTQVYSLSTPARSFHSNGSNPKDKLRRIGVSPSTIICQHLIQEGTYGRIYTGILHHALGETRDVLIKTVVDGTSLSQVGFLLAEASLLCGVSHPNLLFPTAAYTELPGPPQIGYPLPAKGNLKLFLQNSKDGFQTSATTLGTRQLVEFGLQVAKGISHLHSLGVLHKDVATRNCVVDFNNNVRVSDTALSRDLFPNDYHCLGDNENRPIKWMAIETLEKKFHTTASDVWSLGVLLWELATLAAMPFEEVDSFELAAYLRDGYRLAQPINCPDEFYTVMSCCWLTDYKQRPSFPQLIAYLHDFHEDLGKYI